MVVDFISTVIALFAIVDPFATIPIFLILFGRASKKKQRKAALEISLAAFILLLVFALIGNPLLKVMQISMPSFMIAGGILLLILSFDFLHGELPRSRHVEMKISDAIVPIGTPLLAGPGAITSSIYFTHQSGILVVLISLIVVFLISFFALFGSRLISKILGSSGLRILTRIMGLITAAVAISLIERAFVIYGILPAII